MEKLAYLIFDEADRSGKELREALIDGVAPKLRAAGAQGILVNVADEDVAAGNPIRNRVPPVRAFVCFWLENSDDRGPCEEALGAVGQGLAGYLVAESRPLVHERRKGQRTEGMNQVTCIARKPGLTDEEFWHIWTVDHKKVAIETQSTVGYVRNVITRPLTEGAPDCWVAIVEETFPIGALTDLKVFYDNASDEEFKERLARMMGSVERFLDAGPMECTPMSEYDLG